MTPGINIIASEDVLGQQYKTPYQAILKDECDIIIVGRGIYSSMDSSIIKIQADLYRKEGWDAYLLRCNESNK